MVKVVRNQMFVHVTEFLGDLEMEGFLRHWGKKTGSLVVGLILAYWQCIHENIKSKASINSQYIHRIQIPP